MHCGSDEKFYDVPAEIDGPVLISGADLSGFEYGPAELNPYAQFQQLKPTAVIQHGVFVFEGHFAMPMAAAMGHVQKAADLLADKQYDSALAEAQTAVTLGACVGEGECHAGRCVAAWDAQPRPTGLRKGPDIWRKPLRPNFRSDG